MLREVEFAPEIPCKKVNPFFKVLNKTIDCCVLCMLSKQSILLYLLLIRRSFNYKGFIYTQQIVKYTGIGKDHISIHINKLVKFKLITIDKKSCKFRYWKYTINHTATDNILMTEQRHNKTLTLEEGRKTLKHLAILGEAT